MRRFVSLPLFAVIFAALFVATPALALEVDVTLRGSPNSMERQNRVAHELGYLFVQDAEEVDSLLEQGVLVRLDGNRHYAINDGVSYPVARPEVRLFIERLANQYYEGTGEQLVVTSLMRPTSEQPRNSHDLSVHPTGIAIDLRISSNRQAQAWLESVLLKLERSRLLDITRESYPPHYHVALFTDAYREYLGEMIGADAVAEALEFREEEPAPEPVLVRSAEQRAAPKAASSMAATVVAGDERQMWTLFFVLAPVAVIVITFLTFFGRREEEDQG